jgi:hypothetical protein
MTTSDVLRKVIRACVDDWRTLRHESRFVDPPRVTVLTRLAGEREQFATVLERLGKREQPHDGSWMELWREAERNLRVAAAGRHSGDAVRSCEHSRARTEAAYDKALEAPLPEDIQSVLADQRRRLQREADELIDLEFLKRDG